MIRECALVLLCNLKMKNTSVCNSRARWIDRIKCENSQTGNIFMKIKLKKDERRRRRRTDWTTVNLVKPRIQWSCWTKGEVRSLIHANETVFTGAKTSLSFFFFNIDLSLSPPFSLSLYLSFIRYSILSTFRKWCAILILSFEAYVCVKFSGQNIWSKPKHTATNKLNWIVIFLSTSCQNSWKTFWNCKNKIKIEFLERWNFFFFAIDNSGDFFFISFTWSVFIFIFPVKNWRRFFFFSVGYHKARHTLVHQTKVFGWREKYTLHCSFYFQFNLFLSLTSFVHAKFTVNEWKNMTVFMAKKNIYYLIHS